MGRFESYFVSDPDDFVIENPPQKPVVVEPVAVFQTFITAEEPGK